MKQKKKKTTDKIDVLQSAPDLYPLFKVFLYICVSANKKHINEPSSPSIRLSVRMSALFSH